MDNGIGFEEKNAEKIFRIFHRLHGRNDYQGTGVGLFIVKKVVEKHHGYITANSKPGAGAIFNVYLPVG
jgi:light-regulated signal transduction histidine kinase (bacteriophytochrome)